MFSSRILLNICVQMSICTVCAPFCTCNSSNNCSPSSWPIRSHMSSFFILNKSFAVFPFKISIVLMTEQSELLSIFFRQKEGRGYFISLWLHNSSNVKLHLFRLTIDTYRLKHIQNIQFSYYMR